MIILYGMFPSRASCCVWALEEAQVKDYEIKRLDFSKGEQRAPEYLELNPLGKVPTLQIGDKIIRETIAILEYIGRAYPKSRLVPENSGDYVTYLQWISYLLTEVEAPFWTLLKHTRILPEEKRVPQVSSTCLWEIERALTPLEDLLSSGSGFLVGKSFSNADIVFTTLLSFLRSHIPLTSFSSCQRYLQEQAARPAYLRMLERTDG